MARPLQIATVERHPIIHGLGIKERAIPVPGSLFDHRATPTIFGVYLGFASIAPPDGSRATVTVKHIAEKSKVSRATFRKGLAWLLERGVLTKDDSDPSCPRYVVGY